MTDDELKELRRLADAAESGSWEFVEADDPRGQPVPYYPGVVCIVTDNRFVVTQDRFTRPDQWPEVGRYIAAANPVVVKELLDEIDRLRAQLADAVEALERVVKSEDCPCGGPAEANRRCGYFGEAVEMARAALARIKEGK